MANSNTTQALAVGEVTATKGEVFAKNADGQMRRLSVGDKIFAGDVIVSANGSSAEINLFNGQALNITEQQSVAVDTQVASTTPDNAADTVAGPGSSEAARVIQTVASGEQDFNALLNQEAAAAGLTGGDGGGGSSFVDLARIVEAVPTTGYDFPINPAGNAPEIEGQGLVPQVANAPSVTEPPVVPPVEPPVVPPVEPPHDNKGHGNNTDGQDDDNPGAGSGGPNEQPKDGNDEDEGQQGNQGDDTPGAGHNDGGSGTGGNGGGNQGGGNDDNQGGGNQSGGTGGENNGFGNGDQDAPGNSGGHNNAENSDHTIVGAGDNQSGGSGGENNGFGNGDQDAPGNSGEHNNAENSEHTIVAAGGGQSGGSGGENNGFGNGDQDAPGNSGSHNNAENSSHSYEGGKGAEIFAWSLDDVSAGGTDTVTNFGKHDQLNFSDLFNNNSADPEITISNGDDSSTVTVATDAYTFAIEVLFDPGVHNPVLTHDNGIVKIG